MSISDRKNSQLFAKFNHSRAAFSLVEVTIALGLLSFCLVAMLGMLPVGLMQERGSTDKLAAIQVLAAVESDFQNTSASGQTTKYKIKTAVGDKGSFYVDQSFQFTDQASTAEYNVWYEIAGQTGAQSPVRMHMFVGRIRPDGLAQQNVVAEGIAQKRFIN